MTRVCPEETISWVESASGRKCSRLGKRVAVLLAYVAGGGIYNAPIKPEKIEWDDQWRIEVVWSSALVSWDRWDLSALWVAANRMMLRVEVDAATYQRLRLSFCEQTSREWRTGSCCGTLPTCEEIIGIVDRDLKAYFEEGV
jgi:hypothetical protein